MDTLSAGQRRALELVSSGCNVCILGAPGTGKTYLIREIMRSVRDCAVSAMTACAAVQISSIATTFHRAAGIGLGDKPASAYRSRRKWSAVYNADVFVVDEVSMLSAELFEKFLDIFEDHMPQLVFIGDFMQLPPVSREVDRAKFCFESSRWSRTFRSQNHVILSENFRQDSADALAKALVEIRDGKISDATIAALRARTEVESIPGSVKLYAHRESARAYNMKQFDALKTLPICEFGWAEFVAQEALANIEFLRKGVLAEPAISLREGTRVMVIANTAGLYNGLQGTVADPSVPTIVRDDTGQTVAIAKYTWSHGEGRKMATITQIPLIHSWAITVHKSQGSTLAAVEFSIDRKMFAAGQAYVALSRAKSIEGIKLVNFDPAVLTHVDALAVEFYRELAEHT